MLPLNGQVADVWRRLERLRLLGGDSGLELRIESRLA